MAYFPPPPATQLQLLKTFSPLISGELNIYTWFVFSHSNDDKMSEKKSQLFFAHSVLWDFFIKKNVLKGNIFVTYLSEDWYEYHT